MATKYQQIADVKYCPVCRTLPLSALGYGIDHPLLEYLVNDDAIDIDSESDKQFDKCALYYSVRSLKRIWSGQSEFPAERIPERWQRAYTCAGSNSATAITDPHTPLSKVQESNWFRAIHSDPLSPEVVRLWCDWIQQCDETHQGCRVDGNPLLPTRVLDLGVDSSSIVKLVETRQSQRGLYIALSHCWGKSNPFITTRENLKDMMGSGFLPDDALPTFRDAIAVARKLDIRYLWIDSLCIIQGDVRDWEIESSKMAAIYQDATLTLASHAEADIEGFLEPRPISHSTLRITSPSGHTAEIFLQFRGTSEAWQAENKVQPIDTRGWCLQEKYLSRRQIRFLKDKISWSCRDAEWDESHRSNGWQMAGTGGAEQTMNLLRGSTPRRHRTLNSLTLYQGWYRMVKDFTRRNLTFASDVLPAVSGLASVVAEHDQGRYLAGIWCEDVAFGLCWQKSSMLSKPGEYIAPSWSWASVVGPVEFIDEYEQYGRQNGKPAALARFLGFHIQPTSSNEYGQISNAWIKLEAPIFALKSAEQDTFCVLGMESELDQAKFSFDLDDRSGEELSVVLLLRRDDISKSNWPTPIKEPVDALLFGLIVHPVLGVSVRNEALDFTIQDQVYARVGFFQVLTSITREIEFWRKSVLSMTLI